MSFDKVCRTAFIETLNSKQTNAGQKATPSLNKSLKNEHELLQQNQLVITLPLNSHRCRRSSASFYGLTGKELAVFNGNQLHEANEMPSGKAIAYYKIFDFFAEYRLEVETNVTLEGFTDGKTIIIILFT